MKTHCLLKPRERGSEVAETYDIAGGKGGIGFIASMTEPFCKNCSRLRLTADGKMRSCLFSEQEVDIRDAVRNGASQEALQAIIREAVVRKPAGHGIVGNVTEADKLPKIRFVGG